jgi:RUNX transcription factor Lozenge
MMGAAEWVGYSSPPVASSYSSSFQSYDQSGMLPAVLPNESYNLSEYGSMGQNAAAASYGSSQFTSLTPWPNEMDQYNNTYGYNSYQYSCQPPAQTQYPPPPTVPPGQPTMLLYPQVYSTVNQNQIHLHLHGSDKLVEQYLGGAAMSSSSSGISGGITPSDNNPFSVVGNCNNQRAINDIPMISQSEEIKHQEQTVVDQDAGDQSVWRPYEKSINYM